MKFKIIYTLLMCASSVGFAQSDKHEITDNLVPNKEQVLAEYIPMANNQYLYEMYVIAPEKMIEKLDNFEASFASELAKEEDAQLRELKKLDLKYFKRNVLSQYAGLYGLDSLGSENLQKLMTTKKGDPNFSKLLQEAQKKLFVKKLSKTEREFLNGKVTENTDLSNEELFKKSAAYRNWIDRHINSLRRSKYGTESSPLGYFGEDLVKIDVVNREISNAYIKEYLNYTLTSKFIKGAKDENTINDVYAKFMANATNSQFKKEVKGLYDNYKAMAPNSPAPHFSYQDVNGKTVSLTDLRGKYVYIDVWATWCGPCKAEIPFLKKVEKKFHGKDIHFVSLSVDKMKDKQKWSTYVKENNLKGVQVMADKDFSSDFVKKFNINAIPRFILIDPKGRIVDHDAKRPSNPALTTQLESLLN
ncbi:TlpA family protein disulfide reductase [Flavobacteriaceae bacterium F08102]|nr:TlpA family protein disulfide reductase [Flavobacteriaceae bacterium F08102]